MAKAARLTDTTEKGGIIISGGESSVRINGKAVAVKGALVSSHHTNDTPHKKAVINETSSSVKAGGKGIIRVGDKATCAHKVTSGSSDVSIGG